MALTATPPHRSAAIGARLSQQGHLFVESRVSLPVLLYLLCVMIPIGVNAGPLYLTSLKLFLIFLTIPMLVRLLMGKYGRVFAVDILFILHLVWATIALSVNNPSSVVEQTGSTGLEFLGGYLLGRAYIRTAEDFAALCRVLAVLTVMTLPLAIYETLTGAPLLVNILEKLPAIRSVEVVSFEKRMGLERVQLGFAHPILYGLFCSVVFSLTIVALKGVASTGWRYFFSGIVGLCCFLSLSSGAILAILLQLMLIGWSMVFARLKHRWLLLTGIFVLIYIAIDLLSNRTPIRVFMSYATFSAETAYWRSLIFEWGSKNVWSSPIFGIGLNDWFRPEWMFISSVDNYWLLMAMRYGLPGFALVAIPYIMGIWHVGRRDFSGNATLTQFRRAWVFTFIGLTFTLCTVHIWGAAYSFVFFMYGAGMWLITVPSTQMTDTAPAPARAGHNPYTRTQRSTPDLAPAATEAVTAAIPRPSRYTRFDSTP